MYTAIAPHLADVPEAQEAADLLRACVHCGFCLATCPTYQVTGDELDSPRGRIYLMKSLVEGADPGLRTQYHLDRCLTCKACESTCPSGVQYGRLVEAGRSLLEKRFPRGLAARVKRAVIRGGLAQSAVFGAAVKLGQLTRPLLPAGLAASVPPERAAGIWPAPRHARRMAVLDGCVQPAIDPGINAAAARVLDQLGISLVRMHRVGCCGALPHHTGDTPGALAMVRANVDVWAQALDSGAIEAIVMTASGCGSEVREYGHLLRHDSAYASRAAQVSAATRDLSEVLQGLGPQLAERIGTARRPAGEAARIAYHPPCSLQHGQKVRGHAEQLLRDIGFEPQPFADSHLCCGSAGSYSLLQPALSKTLQTRKLEHLLGTRPSCIATANIGCQAHLQSGTSVPVRHWINLIDGLLAATPASA